MDVRWTESEFKSDDLSMRRPVAVVIWQSPARYDGRSPWTALYVKTATLYTTRLQPVQLPQDRCDVVQAFSSRHQASCGVLYGLQPLEKLVGNAEQQPIAIVQPAHDERLSYCFYGID